MKSPAFTLWTLSAKTRCLEDTESPGMLFLVGHLDIVGCYFHGPSWGQVRLFAASHFAAPPYVMERRGS
ncbi:MAG TPA: hypothetical protein VG796_21205 [Verrucomicrobiales bacterium]|jgi:hypothetical protein|nr:hypothetical protein [Verrucomicrobiales bacterium]